MRSFRFLFLVVFLVVGILQSHAQVTVNLKTSRRLYIMYEPLIATVTITNRTGGALRFEDSGSHQWFGFDIVRQDGTPISPANGRYSLEPMTLESGQTIKRSINLTPLYPLHEYGMHRIRARVYSADTQEFFVSAPHQVDITEGKTLSSDVVGVPGERSKRWVTLLSHRIPQGNRLYIRIKDEDAGVIYATTKLGRLLSYGKPMLKFDQNNEVHLLHKVSPGMYHYFHFNLNGQLQESGRYVSVGKKSFPKLYNSPDGAVVVRGGMISAPVAESVDNPRPKLSDRPEGLPENTSPPGL